ncbi:unnamed protein product [Rotaria sordida]|uniref:Uncharacterized protein n=2 Tax=Rotaria sordida TaxID=392033 RepID=A0A820HEB7_9BILA|nr:unnamed protein product [Rotaria sordida]
MNPLNLQTEIEYNIYLLKKQADEKKIDWGKIREDIKIVAHEYIKKVKIKYIYNLSIDEIKALKELKEDRSIIILRADKGNAVVIMNKLDYMNKVEELLEDQNKFCPVKKDESANDENLINRRFAQLKKD